MNQNNSNRGLWIAGIVIIIVILLGWWWIASNQSNSMNMDNNGQTATSTVSTTTTTTSTGSTGSTGGSVSVTTENGDTVKDIVASLPNASQYQSLFSSTGVASLIGSGGQFTIFVPTNAAFASLPAGTISNMTAAQLKRMIEYSIVSGRAIQSGTEMTGAVAAYSGDSLNFTDLNNIPMVNSSIVTSEYKGSNGVVYVINEVLLPPAKNSQ